ncbi:MAG: L-2-amino-thiazoline-4-carboxylic acid hydrolase [Thermoplasmata archaeon]
MTEEMIGLKEAAKEVELVSRRVALLHISYAKMLTEEFGEERGRELILKAVKGYGRIIGEKRRKEIEERGMEPVPKNFGKGDVLRIPRFGVHSRLEETEDSMKLYGCAMGKLWREYGEEELGKLYCYVDPAKYMGFNEDFIQVHRKAVPAGGDFCEFVVRPSTEEERELFRSDKKDFSDADPGLKG